MDTPCSLQISLFQSRNLYCDFSNNFEFVFLHKKASLSYILHYHKIPSFHIYNLMILGHFSEWYNHHQIRFTACFHSSHETFHAHFTVNPTSRQPLIYSLFKNLPFFDIPYK